MLGTLDVNPKHYPSFPDVAYSASRWFEAERMSINFSDYVGRPQGSSIRSNVLSALFQEGWVVTSVRTGSSGGRWKKVVSTVHDSRRKTEVTSEKGDKSNSKTTGTAYNRNKSKGNSRSHEVNALDFVKSGDVANRLLGDSGGRIAEARSQSQYGDKTVDEEGSSTARGNYTDTVTQQGDGHSEENSDVTDHADDEVTYDGDPYWSSYTIVGLARRRLQADKLMQDMMSDLAASYNHGREIDAKRYDEIVDLYALMLSKTEDELLKLDFSADSLKPLIDDIVSACKDALDQYREKVGDIPDDWWQSRIDEINRKFDALLSELRSQHITNGTYNSTIWSNVQSGVERDRQIALTDLKDEMVTLRIDAYGKIAGLTADIGKSILDAATRFAELQKELLYPIDFRNKVMQNMLDFMAQRENPYSKDTEIGAIADRLGTMQGATVRAS